jgi:hypothetical protein
MTTAELLPKKWWWKNFKAVKERRTFASKQLQHLRFCCVSKESIGFGKLCAQPTPLKWFCRKYP